MNLENIAKRMDGALSNLQKEYASLRTGHASPSLLEPITVVAYGKQTPLTHLATITNPEPRLLTINVWDKNLVKPIEKALSTSGLGLSARIEDKFIHLPIPELTHERRQELARTATKYAEQARIAIRNVRRDGMEQLKRQEKEGTLSKNEHKSQANKIQTLTDDHIQKVELLLKKKEQEILFL